MTQINDTLDVARDPIKPRSFSRPFWEATREKRLLLQFDPAAQKYQFYPRATSIHTGRRTLEWRESPGKGEVFSFTVARRARPPFQGKEPFIIAVVTLDEGVNVMGDMVDCQLDEMKIGLRVKPYWAPMPDGTHLLLFQPDRG
ncbi:MAG TPA: Zn-ribbon domain-containing OB-fold protein [Beijerinckiaceae bacterium]